VHAEAILRSRQVVDSLYVDPKVRDYIVDLVHATREPRAYGLDLGPYVQYGASPRATLALTLCAKAAAYLDGRGYVVPQDVKSIAPDVLRHRLVLTYEAEAESMTSDTLVQRLLEHLPVP
jgi:MoxR-like ATPase